MNVMHKTVAMLEAWWAKHHVHLAPEPAGERTGLVGERYAGDDDARPFTLVAVGDSMVAGCGVETQEDGLIPDLARGVADVLERPVRWSTHGRLGATMRRVRYRLLPEVDGKPDLLVLCAGSNDIMAQRSVREWSDDLAATLDEAKALADDIVVYSCGQLYNSPSLGATLRRYLEGRIDEQTEASKRICAERGVIYLDMTHEDVKADDAQFYASDHFHPGRFGYRYMADRSVELLHDHLLSIKG
ncbi:SGNH/GDSL hydrolase family protein [Bifidobacterium sp. SMB2]|uniref:SGNH/GDSL hydrolase family protein n=1 Tax=Bifidobacterium saimiriisciurei TaxID=2661627 RepID=A0ABX0CAJ5_9BIFI|nr:MULTISPECIES: SGNH/GDSL hydrolase family protein [Bifidobacterium]NEG95797.1 SGNH/GDSL hydrolase family protein [Bifidobacterium sp. SMB2]NEH11224.1 SGNH/GDSL hydrolase family protein [Bifidobacterium saimiriisciurei]